jgi:hypothetical protein
MFKKSTTRPICGYCNGYKKNQQLYTKLICEYYNGCKKNQQLFIRFVCEYCIFEMALWKL